jgi:hypothetical protein
VDFLAGILIITLFCDMFHTAIKIKYIMSVHGDSDTVTINCNQQNTHSKMSVSKISHHDCYIFSKMMHYARKKADSEFYNHQVTSLTNSTMSNFYALPIDV